MRPHSEPCRSDPLGVRHVPALAHAALLHSRGTVQPIHCSRGVGAGCTSSPQSPQSSQSPQSWSSFSALRARAHATGRCSASGQAVLSHAVLAWTLSQARLFCRTLCSLAWRAGPKAAPRHSSYVAELSPEDGYAGAAESPLLNPVGARDPARLGAHLTVHMARVRCAWRGRGALAVGSAVFSFSSRSLAEQGGSPPPVCRSRHRLPRHQAAALVCLATAHHTALPGVGPGAVGYVARPACAPPPRHHHGRAPMDVQRERAERERADGRAACARPGAGQNRAEQTGPDRT